MFCTVGAVSAGSVPGFRLGVPWNGAIFLEFFGPPTMLLALVADEANSRKEITQRNN